MSGLPLSMEHQRRYSHHYERLIASKRLQLVFGMLVVVIAPALYQAGLNELVPGDHGWWLTSDAQWHAMIGTGVAYTLSITAVNRLSRLPGTRSYLYVVPTIVICYLMLMLALGVFDLDYSRHQVGLSFLLAVSLCTAYYYIDTHVRRMRFAVVPFGKAPALCQRREVEWLTLKRPDLVGMRRIDGVVADLRAEMPREWESFLADCTIHRIPVYHATQAHEMITGRVLLDHLYANEFGSLMPREDYEVIKRWMDFSVALVLLPLLAPVMLLTALAIRLDSPGPVVFRQPRMGFHCRPFTVYKFRSMYDGMKGAGFTQEGSDPRITRVGRFIRKCRLDELPQLFNVLKGDMSLIGPRPESMNLADWYRKDVPFFHYRHVVRPGITGWAQVEQGYAAEVEGMIRKLEYDFFYIKHFSFWLDLLVVIRTIRIVISGNGSR
ncbi:exopolysaccharide biosynthesis polyprenyl glycosylphosphotransferase [Cobetia marina]|uniref:exopolysaccharide biosynthesis polyprenyl glycosylphosphotransferase n=1 Tax=Cobetia marina TaxID=28258 RepID=UPI0026E1AA32|nr:exopolysaccharide biosynthesis polyprenyl glycosylphosphotransferase [Cobetia marina]MDO6786130.1 exopolysaccharide biosynthesis polyprenyl glycosylphosphotransferase [Cobetia marina]